MTHVSVFMDIEDPINPSADDAALDIAKLFSEVGIKGSFCFTGEKCRSLLSRGRGDVLEAYQPHCLGLHTDTHSYHPTTMEMLAEVSYEEGCLLALSSESRGFEAFHSAFQRKPAFWGGAGNTWSPEITHAIAKLGIPAYSYALTSLPNLAAHQFNGVMAFPQSMSIREDDWIDDERAAKCSDDILQSVQLLGSPWLGLFVGHPSRLRHAQFWDASYLAGRTPSSPEPVPTIEESEYQQGLANLRDFLERLKRSARVLGMDEAIQLDWRLRKPDQAELEHFRTETSKAIRGAARWPINRPNLDPERIVQKTLALESTLMVAELA